MVLIDFKSPKLVWSIVSEEKTQHSKRLQIHICMFHAMRCVLIDHMGNCILAVHNEYREWYIL